MLRMTFKVIRLTTTIQELRRLESGIIRVVDNITTKVQRDAIDIVKTRLSKNSTGKLAQNIQKTGVYIFKLFGKLNVIAAKVFVPESHQGGVLRYAWFQEKGLRVATIYPVNHPYLVLRLYEGRMGRARAKSVRAFSPTPYFKESLEKNKDDLQNQLSQLLHVTIPKATIKEI